MSFSTQSALASPSISCCTARFSTNKTLDAGDMIFFNQGATVGVLDETSLTPTGEWAAFPVATTTACRAGTSTTIPIAVYGHNPIRASVSKPFIAGQMLYYDAAKKSLSPDPISGSACGRAIHSETTVSQDFVRSVAVSVRPCRS